MPSAMLFIDLRSGQGARPRGTPWGTYRSPCSTADLGQGGFEEELVEKMTQAHGVLPGFDEGAPWLHMVYQGKGVCTARGSRPGSPLADALFHCLSPIVKQIEAKIAASPVQQTARAAGGSGGVGG